MKIKMIRLSGNPVDPEKQREYEDAWKAGFDEIIEKHGKYGSETSEGLDKLEKSLKDEYNDLTVIEVPMPKSKKAWKELLSLYGNVIVTTAAETNHHIKEGDIMFVINDMVF